MIDRKLTIHCSDTKNNENYDIEKIRDYHVRVKKWDDVGYHWVIQPDGEVQNGRPLNKMGAHVLGHNVNNIGLCMIGTDRFTINQFDSLRKLMDYATQYGDTIKKWNIFGHYEFDTANGKTCPNMRIADLLVWYFQYEYGAIKKYLFKDPLFK